MPRVHRFWAGPTLGRGHHVYPDQGRVPLPSGGDRYLVEAGSRCGPCATTWPHRCSPTPWTWPSPAADPDQVIHHSDRGSQYTSTAFGTRCRQAGIAISMGRRGDAYDNAVAESFFATLETELLIRTSFANRNQARSEVFDHTSKASTTHTGGIPPSDTTHPPTTKGTPNRPNYPANPQTENCPQKRGNSNRSRDRTGPLPIPLQRRRPRIRRTPRRPLRANYQPHTHPSRHRPSRGLLPPTASSRSPLPGPQRPPTPPPGAALDQNNESAATSLSASTPP